MQNKDNNCKILGIVFVVLMLFSGSVGWGISLYWIMVAIPELPSAEQAEAMYRAIKLASWSTCIAGLFGLVAAGYIVLHFLNRSERENNQQ